MAKNSLQSNQEPKKYSPLTQYIYWLKSNNQPFPTDAKDLYNGTLLNLTEDDWRSCVYMNSLLNEDLLSFYNTKADMFGMLHKKTMSNPNPQYIKTSRPNIQTLKEIRKKYPHLKLNDIELYLSSTDDADGFLESIGLKDIKVTKTEKSFALLHSILEQSMNDCKQTKKYYDTNVDNISDVNVLFLGSIYQPNIIFPSIFKYVSTNVCIYETSNVSNEDIKICYDNFTTILSMLDKKVIIVPYTDLAIQRCGIEDDRKKVLSTVYKFENFTVVPIASLEDKDRLDLVNDIITGEFTPRVRKENKKTNDDVNMIKQEFIEFKNVVEEIKPVVVEAVNVIEEEILNVDNMLADIKLDSKLEETIDSFMEDFDKPKQIITQEVNLVEDSMLVLEDNTSNVMLVDTLYIQDKENGDTAYQIFRNKDQKIIQQIDTKVEVYSGDNSKTVMPKNKLKKHTIEYRNRWFFMKDNPNSFAADLSFAVHKNTYWRKTNKEAHYNLRIAMIDIEIYTFKETLDFSQLDVDAKKFPINLITLYDNYVDKYFTFVYNLNKSKFDMDKIKSYFQYDVDNVELLVFEDEDKMLFEFIQKLNSLEVDLITGYNTDNFDIPYIIYRCNALNVPLNWRMRKYTKREQEYIDIDIPFVFSLDYLRLYKEASFGKRESYKLGFIAEHELNITKLELDGNMNRVFDNEPEKFIAYNINDVHLVRMLENKLKYIELMYGIVQITNVGWNEIYTTLKLMDGLIYTYLYDKEQIFISRREDNTKEGLIGAYVRTPNKGIYEWVCDLDLASLYPYIIARWNLSPDTYIGKINDTDMYNYIYHIDEFKKQEEIMLTLSDNRTIKTTTEKFDNWIKTKKYIVTIAGTIFKSHEEELSILYEIVELMIDKRKEFKDKMFEAIEKNNDNLADRYNNIQTTYKVLTNSLYGAMSNAGFRFFSNEVAQTITKTGREISKLGSYMANEYLHKMAKEKTIDADFIDIDKNFLMKAEEKLDTIIYGDSVLGNTNVYVNGIEMCIEELWDTHYYPHRDVHNGHVDYYEKERIHFTQPTYTLTVNDKKEQIELDMDYIMRHRARKKLYRIRTNTGKVVDVTEDHSIMILNDKDELIEVKPNEMPVNARVVSINDYNPVERKRTIEQYEDVFVYDSISTKPKIEKIEELL